MEAAYLDLGGEHANDIAVLQQSIATTSIQFSLTASVEDQNIQIAYLGTEWDPSMFVDDPEGADPSVSDKDSSAPVFSDILVFLVSLCVLLHSEN